MERDGTNKGTDVRDLSWAVARGMDPPICLGHL